MTTLSSSAPPAEGFNYVDGAYFQDGKVLTAILTALLYLILAISLDAAGWIENLSMLVPVTIGAYLLGMMMAFSRFDGFFALSHSLFTGLAWILYLMTGLVTEGDIEPFIQNNIPEIQAQAYFVLLQWLNWVDDALNKTANENNFIFIFEMSFLLWWLTYLGVWAIFRHGYVWRVVIPAGIVLLINSFYAPSPVTGFLLIFSMISMVLLVRTNLAEQQLRWREQRFYFSPDIVFDFLRNGFIYSVIVLAMAWIVPGLGRSFQVRQILQPINQQWDETMQRWDELNQGLNRQSRPALSTFGKSLSLGGERNVGNKVIFHARASSGRYWRAVIYDTFTGRGWLNTIEEEQTFEANQPIPIANWRDREPITQTLTLFSPTGNVLFGAPDILRASIPIAAIAQPVPIDPLPIASSPDNPFGGRAMEFTLAHSSRPLEIGESYTVLSYQTTVTQRALRATSATYPDEISERYLQLPPEFSPAVSELAQTVTANHETVYDKVRAMESFLRGFTYNESIPAPPLDQDPIEYFLFDIQEGYCDYYATSMTMMLRSLGIPARTASGYAEGLYEEESDVYIVTEQDAHTWVEVYFPGYGWIEFEPTAGESTLTRPLGSDESDQNSPDSDLGRDSNDNEFPNDPLSDPNQNQNLLPEENFLPDDNGAVVEQRSIWLWLLLTPIALILCGVLIWRTNRLGPTAFVPDLPPILYERLQGWAERLGFRIHSAQTPYEQSQYMRQALPQGEPHIRKITEAYVQYRFAPESIQEQTARAAFQKTEEVEAIHPEEREQAASNLPLARSELPDAWDALRPIFWKEWLRQAGQRIFKRSRNRFRLQK